MKIDDYESAINLGIQIEPILDDQDFVDYCDVEIVTKAIKIIIEFEDYEDDDEATASATRALKNLKQARATLKKK